MGSSLGQRMAEMKILGALEDSHSSFLRLFWIDIQQIQLRQQNGHKIVHVVTAHGARDFALF
jgi:hypothetical protein